MPYLALLLHPSILTHVIGLSVLNFGLSFLYWFDISDVFVANKMENVLFLQKHEWNVLFCFWESLLESQMFN